MKRMTSVTVALAVALCCLFVSENVQAAQVWPHPTSISQMVGVAYLDPKTFTITTNSNSQILQQAITRYLTGGLIFPFKAGSLPAGNTPVLKTVTITVQSSNEDLQLGVNEAYTLDLTLSGSVGNITAPTIWGAIRALETFSQVVDFNIAAGTYAVTTLPVQIQDNPRFEWRGLLIDTARHYLPVSTILRTIDALSYSKFNTLHWHAVDAESFPICSKQYPLLCGKGAYGNGMANYTQQQISQIVSYGKARGIRVVPEFDTPGHAYSWGFGYPQLVVNCPKYESNINNIPLDPTQDFTYDVISSLFTEMSTLFTDNCFHIGGDEVITGCWSNNANVTQWMSQHGMSSTTQLLQYYEDNLKTIMTNINKTTVAWEDLFDGGIKMPAQTIYEVWDESSAMGAITSAGFRAINAYGYYLDQQTPLPGATYYEWVDTWKAMYGHDPITGVSSHNANLVIGGEAVMFAEQVDETNFDSRVWPRACAVAERLWSPSTITDLNDATSRLVEHRCRLARRGIGAGPIAPDFCPLPTWF